MLNIATMGILKGNANPETPGGEKRPPKGLLVELRHSIDTSDRLTRSYICVIGSTSRS